MTSSPLLLRCSGLRAPCAVVALLCLLATPAAAQRLENLDVDLSLPVYSLGGGIPTPGEALRYSLRWAGIELGDVEMAMEPAQGGSALDLAVRGSTSPAFSWIYSLRFSGEGRVRTGPVAPDGFSIQSCQGSRHKTVQVSFPEGEGEPIRSVRHKQGRRPKQYVFHSENSYDVPSALVLLLNLDYAPGQEYRIDTFTGEARYLVTARVVGREAIRLGERRVRAWHLRLHTRDLLEEDPDPGHRGTSVWLSDASPRRLLRARADTWAGAVTMELDDDAVGSLPIAASCDTPSAPVARAGF